MRLLALAAALLAPLSAHAFVAFTNSNFNGITAGQPFELTWQGDGTVRFVMLVFYRILTSILQLSSP